MFLGVSVGDRKVKLWCCAVGRGDQLENSRVTIRIARRVGTSTGTVSRALNDKEGVGEELRNRIKAIAKEYGYVPRRQIQGSHVSLAFDPYPGHQFLHPGPGGVTAGLE